MRQLLRAGFDAGFLQAASTTYAAPPALAMNDLPRSFPNFSSWAALDSPEMTDLPKQVTKQQKETNP